MSGTTTYFAMNPQPDESEDGEPPMDADYASLTEEQVRQFVEQIPTYSEKTCEMARKLSGTVLDYSAESIPRLDDLIAENWPDGPPTLLDNMVLAYGSYLGETIRTLHGGDWCHSDEMGFHLDIGGMKVFPFAKIRRRFLNGKEDSLGLFYQVIWTELSRRQNPFEEIPVKPPAATPPPVPPVTPVSSTSPAVPPAATPPPVPPAPPSPPPIPRLTPVLTPLPPARPVKKKPAWIWVVIMVLVVVLAAAAFVGFRMVQSVRYALAHPQPAQAGDGNEITNTPPVPASGTTNDAETTLSIQSAKFGSGSKQADVTAKLIEQLQAHPDGFTISAQTLGADPAAGKKKRLTVRYAYNGTNYVIGIPGGKQVSNNALVKNALK